MQVIRPENRCRIAVSLQRVLASAATFVLPIMASAAAERPNIVFILADDLGWGDPPCYNPESKIPMPHLGRLLADCKN